MHQRRSRRLWRVRSAAPPACRSGRCKRNLDLFRSRPVSARCKRASRNRDVPDPVVELKTEAAQHRVSGSRSLDPRAICQSNTIPGPKPPKGAQGAQDASPNAIAEAARVQRQLVYRVQDDPAKAEAMVVECGLCVGSSCSPETTRVRYEIAPGADTGLDDRQCVNTSVCPGARCGRYHSGGVGMQSGRRNRAGAACGMAILVALAQSSPGNAEAPGASLAPPLCPRAKAQKNPFDETSVTFDSVSEKRDERSTLVTYCVHVDAPKNKHLVDWPDTNMKDVFTDTDGGHRQLKETPWRRTADVRRGGVRRWRPYWRSRSKPQRLALAKRGGGQRW